MSKTESKNIALGFSKKKSRKNNNINNNTKNNNNGEKIKDCCTIGDRRPPLPEVRGEPAVSGSLGRFERPIWEGACTGVQESQVIEAIYKMTRGGGGYKEKGKRKGVVVVTCSHQVKWGEDMGKKIAYQPISSVGESICQSTASTLISY